MEARLSRYIGGLGMTSGEIRQYTLRVFFRDGICSQAEGNGEFGEEDASEKFLSLRSVHPCKEEVHCLPRGEYMIYCESLLALKSI